MIRWFIRPCHAGYKALAAQVRNRAAKLKDRAAQAANSETSTRKPLSEGLRRSRDVIEELSLPLSPTMQDIVADRPGILTQISWLAEQGMVADGSPLRLLASYEAELAEHRFLLAAELHTFQAGMQHLAALFPLPTPPEPVPIAPPRRRHFPPLGDLLAQRLKRPLH